MKKLMLGCQTITWGENQSKDFPKVFREIKSAGFEGVEIGWRRLSQTKASGLKTLLEDAGLKLIGVHMGGNLKDDSQAKGEWAVLDNAVEFLNELDAKFLMFSGLRYNTEEQLKNDLNVLVGANERCASMGVKFLYHNHDWEFKNGRKAFEALLDSPLEFCPDLGWVFKAGEDVVSVLKEIKGRIGAVHFKDFKNRSQAKDEWLNPVILGSGMTPLTDGAKWLKENIDEPLWCITEQDFADVPPQEAALKNAGFLNANL